MLAFVVLIIAFASTEAFNIRSNSKIVGGQDTTIKNHPYQVSLQANGRLRCGGSIIGVRWILTAAHCTDGIQPGDLTIVAGITSLIEIGEQVKVKEIHQHPKYTPATLDYDISVLLLERPVTLSAKAFPIDLANDGFDPEEGSNVVVTGWGTTSEGGVISNVLQEAKIPVVGRVKCNEIYESIGFPQVTKRMMCASPPEGGKDHCNGDSGGPLIANGKQVGIVSWANGCARAGYPGVNSNVGTLREFITGVTGI